MNANPPKKEQDDAYEPDILTLEDEAGQEHLFEVIDTADVNDEHYLAMAPYAQDAQKALEEDAVLLFMRLVQEDGEEEFLEIVEDEEELAVVADVFCNRLSELYDIDVEDLK